MHQFTKNSVAIDIFKSLRPKQWTKNFFVFAAILFSQNIYNVSLLFKVVAVFIIFSLLSSSIYLINDVADIEKDKNHPKKKHRPIAAGRVPSWAAILLSIILLTFSLGASFALNFNTGLVSLIYLLQSIFYTLYFKNIVIMDVLLIAFGFILRVVAGGVVINVDISVWLLICVTLLALFLALCKRRNEISLLSKNASSHREILDSYSIGLLDQMISIVTSSTLVVYSLYTFLSSPNLYLMFTIPFVLYGIFRYLFLVHKKEGGGEPEDIVLKDKPMILNILLWVLVSYFALYL